MTDLIIQPTASVDAEQVWREAYTRFNATIAVTTGDGNQAATAVIQAYGDARADAARREALEEAAVWIEKHGPSDDIGNYDAACHLRALKENPNAG